MELLNQIKGKTPEVNRPSFDKPKNFEQPPTDCRTKTSRPPIDHSPLRHSDVPMETTCHSPSRQNSANLYIDTKTTNKDYNNSHSQSATEFQNFITSLFPEERESFEKFVNERIAELPRKVVLKDEWLIALTKAGKPRWESLRTEWENVEKLKSYTESSVPTGIDDLAKRLIDWLTKLTSAEEVRRNLYGVVDGWVYGNYVDQAFRLEAVASLNFEQIKAMFKWRCV